MFLGCDLSLTGSGLVVIDANYKIIDSTLLSTPLTGVERLAFLKKKFVDFISNYKITQAAVEGGAYNEIGRIYQIGQWAGVAHLILFENNISFFEVPPLRVKKYVSGQGRKVTKQLVILDVYKQFKEEIRDDNIADAYVLSRIARDLYFFVNHPDMLSTTSYRKEILEKITSELKSQNLLS